MEGANNGGGHVSEPRPPAYNPQQYGFNTGVSYQVGKGNIAVVCPPGAYDNMAYPGDAEAANKDDNIYAEAPPDYSTAIQDGNYATTVHDSEYAAAVEDSDFNNALIRRGFIRKVYLTLMMQLLVTVGIICAFLYWETLKTWVVDTFWFSYSMIGVLLVLSMVLSVCVQIRRQVPLNFIALGLFTAVEGLMLGSLAAHFNAPLVLWAVGATALVSFSLTLFALQTKWDFTAVSGSLWVFAWTLISFACLSAILRTEFLSIFYACLATLLFSLYLVFDTQLILGGKHRKYEISPEEYVFAALSLYLDIASLFIFLLYLLSLCKR